MTELAAWADGGDFDEEAFQDAMGGVQTPHGEERQRMCKLYEEWEEREAAKAERANYTTKIKPQAWDHLADASDEEIDKWCGAEIDRRHREELEQISKFYDDQIARLEEKMYGLEPEEPEPSIN